MKFVKIFFGIIAGLFALAHCIYLPTLLLRESHPSQLLGSLSGLLIGAAISIALFKSAFKQKEKQKNPDESLDKSEGKKDKFRLSKANLILPIIYMSLLFVLYFTNQEKTLNQMAELTGRMICALVVTLLFTWFVWRLMGRSEIIASLTFNIILLFLIIGFIGHFGDRVKLNKELRNIEKSKDLFKEELSKADDPLKIESERQKYINSIVGGFERLSENSTDDKKRYYEIMSSYVNETLLVAQNWQDSLVALQSPEILDYSLLNSDEEFARQRSVINQHIDNTIAYREMHDNMLDTLKSKLSALGEEKRFVKDTIKGATKQYNAQKQILAQFLDANLEHGNNMLRILDLLQKNKDIWRYENGELLIYNDSVLNQFNNLMEELADNEVTITTLSTEMVEKI